MTAGESRDPAWTLHDTTGAKVGDLQQSDGECRAQSNEPMPWHCTANAGHAGPHIAGGVYEVYAVWSDDEASA